MGQNFSHLFNSIRKLLIAFVMFTLCRVLFVLFNLEHFESIEFSAFFYGLRFDMVAIAFLLAPMLILALIPAPFRNFKPYQKTVSSLFYIALFSGLALNLIDLAYFDFTLKRTTANLFGMISTGDDFWTLLPDYIIDFWYAYLVLAILIFVSVKVHKRMRHVIAPYQPYTGKDYLHHTIVFVVSMGVLVLGMRGGFQYKPLSIINAGQYVSAQNIPIVLNTPFAVMKTISSNSIDEKEFFSDNQLEQIYTPEQLITGDGDFKGRNVVIVVLESFSKEYIGNLNDGNGHTPFLDSLMVESYVFTNAYANGQRSIESLPCIYAGLPQLMNSSYITSNYASNQLNGLPDLLKENGYTTSFYHGGANGTMGFNGFTGMVGIDEYKGMNEYPEQLRKDHYDGKWGIFDEPYLAYFANELSKKKQPFFSSIFTLSSHHPYSIPKKHANKFPKGNLAIHESIGYADFALKQFFSSIQNEPWFKNTLFRFLLQIMPHCLKQPTTKQS